MAATYALLLLVAVATASAHDCQSKPEVGLCRGLYPRFFFNQESGQCESFTYGGCGGNENNYDSHEDCTNACAAKPNIDCALKAEVGQCRAYVPSYFYNAKTGECEFFVYGGCNGNSNRFPTKESCHTTCGAYKAPKKVVDCAERAQAGFCMAYIPSYYYNAESGNCEQFIYGGCGGNTNRFATHEECHATCGAYQSPKVTVDCAEEIAVGPCKANIPSFYYNSKTGECESFTYGGCRGNTNRFSTKESCHATCGAKVAPKKTVDCSERAEAGICLAYIPSFFYNVQSGECESFIYGGCGGNTNRFPTKESCHATCGDFNNEVDFPHSLKHCFQEVKMGPCFSAIERYHFNRKTGTCETFIYGGCGGNQNNFGSLKECEDSCLVF